MRILTGIGRGLLALGRGLRLLVLGGARLVAGTGGLLRRGVVAPARALRQGQRLSVLVWLLAVVAAWIAFGTSATVYDTGRIGWGLMPFVGAVAGLPLGLAVVRPLAGLLVSVGAAFVLTESLPRVENGPWPWLVVHGLVILALLFATCVRERPRRAVGAWLLTSALFYWGVQDDVAGGWVVGVSSVAVIGLLAGRLMSTNRALAREAEVSSAEKARRVVLEERTRIARDLHDIVAHHMSLVVVQSETAGYRVPDLSEAARAELLSIGESARSALSETRSLLAVLRQDGEPAHDAPQPELVRLPELIDAARRAGVRLEAQLSGDLGGLRPGASLAGYRIAQEALANAARHAPGAPVLLTAEAHPDGIRLRVENGLLGPVDRKMDDAMPDEIVPGHGITGMRERAAAAGGTLQLGPVPGGGFAVEVFLPVSANGTERS